MTTEEIDALYAQFEKDMLDFMKGKTIINPKEVDNLALARAIERERERCAAIAKSAGHTGGCVAEDLANEIARKIRGEE